MRFREMTMDDLDTVVDRYIEYYNTVEEGCWTYEKACKRIRQVLTTEDALCLLAISDENELVGYLMGYYKEFDDLRSYHLEEILIFKGYHNKGYGTALLTELFRVIRENGAVHLSLESINDEHHMHFYGKFGLKPTTNHVSMATMFE